VVAYHWFGWVWLPFVFPSMGIMFALAGSLVAASLDRADHNPWAVLRKRTMRLLPPLWTLGLVLVPLMLLHDGWVAVQGQGGTPLSPLTLFYWVLPINDPGTSDWGYAEGLTVPLWYIRAYFWFLLLSPAFLWLFRRWPKRTLALPLVTVTLAGLGVLPFSLNGDSTSRIIATMAMFGACWLLGFAHHDGKIRQLPLAFVLPVSGALLGLGAYWTATTNAWQIDDSELGEALYCLGFVLLLLRFYPSFEWLRRRPVLDKVVTVMNSRAMTIYLWGNVAILLAALLLSSGLVPAALVGSETAFKAVGFFLVWVLIGVAVLAVGWVEDVAGGRRARINPWPRSAKTSTEPSRGPVVQAPAPDRSPAAPAATRPWLAGATGMLAIAGAVAAFWIVSGNAAVSPGDGQAVVTVLREAPPAPQPVAVPVPADDGEPAEMVYRVPTELVVGDTQDVVSRLPGGPPAVQSPVAPPVVVAPGTSPTVAPTPPPVTDQPSGSPVPTPTPTPVPEPTPTPVPEPTPTPVPEPTPTPVPEPTPTPVPEPSPTPVPEPSVEPSPAGSAPPSTAPDTAGGPTPSPSPVTEPSTGVSTEPSTGVSPDPGTGVSSSPSAGLSTNPSAGVSTSPSGGPTTTPSPAGSATPSPGSP
jgi:peptidoglycan/LPS O-acetylase OafA/YrhL